MSGIKVFAPASVGNLGIGFDCLGLALEKPGDEVIASKSDTPGLRITQISGAGGKLPYDPEQNTAGVAALRLLEHLGATKQGIELKIQKNMPIGSGMGSSAASAAAAVYAVSELLRTGMSKRELLPFAAKGEQLVSGGIQLDNVATSLLGGIILIRDNATLDVHRLHAPRGLYVALIHPHLELETKSMRGVLKPDVSLQKHIQQSANLASFIVGLFNSDIELLGRSLNDVIIEPQRASFIPGFYEAKEAALKAGALGSSISGAGPAVFALCPNSLIAENAAAGMQAAFAGKGLETTLYLSGINQEGAIVA
ncbi:MAG: homoserine kinase [Saprospiraceae bacterium]